MADRITFDDIRLTAGERPDSARVKPTTETPFRILVLGDFTGRESRGIVGPLAGRRASRVDIDNLDQLLARLGPKLELPVADGSALSISFAAMDEFHPDQIFARLPVFAQLVNVTAPRPEIAADKSAEASKNVDEPEESNEATIARLLGRTSPDPVPYSPTPAGGIEALIKQIVAPHVVPLPDPRAATDKAAGDQAFGAQMRAILHHPQFQALEAAWREVDFLVRNLETDESLEVFLLDVSKSELAADLRASDDLARSAIFRTLVEETVQSPGAHPWAVIAGHFAFGPADEDAEILARIGMIAAAAVAPFLAGAEAEFVERAVEGEGINSEAWASLRKLPQASSIGLAAPRFLLRLPYGQTTEPIESFAFEEISEPSAHETFLWANPAIACACLLGQSFRESEWDFEPGDLAELSGLPMHARREDGEATMTPCAERWLTDRHAENLLGFGIMPLLSIRGRDAARLVRFQSIADPPRSLAGLWA